VIVTREQLESRLLSLRRQQAEIQDQIAEARAHFARLEGRIEEASFWLFELSKEEGQAQGDSALQLEGPTKLEVVYEPGG